MNDPVIIDAEPTEVKVEEEQTYTAKLSLGQPVLIIAQAQAMPEYPIYRVESVTFKVGRSQPFYAVRALGNYGVYVEDIAEQELLAFEVPKE